MRKALTAMNFNKLARYVLKPAISNRKGHGPFALSD